MRRALVITLTLVVLVAMAAALFNYLRAEAPPAELRVTEVSGDVRLDRATGAAPLERGVVLAPADRVATANGSRATLSLGSDTLIRVGPSSSLQVVSVDEDGVSIELEGGALQATVRPESGSVRVGSRGRAVLATNGEFEVGVADEVLQVSATRGSLSLSGVDVTRLDEGQQATVVERHAEVGPVPEELLLELQWPEEARTRLDTTRVSGRTVARATIRLTGSFGVREIVAETDGTFVVDVPLHEGENPIAVEATDTLGKTATIDGMLQTRDTHGPTFRGGVEYERP